MMELAFTGTYYLSGTNGMILFEDPLMMYSIEPPRKDNLARVSCIPEGRYEPVRRWGPGFDPPPPDQHDQVFITIKSDPYEST